MLTLEQRVREIEEFLGLVGAQPRPFDLTATQAKVFDVLRRYGLVTNYMIFQMLYAARPERSQPDFAVVKTFICALRRKLKPYGIEIQIEWGSGYYLTPATKKRIGELLAGREAA